MNMLIVLVETTLMILEFSSFRRVKFLYIDVLDWDYCISSNDWGMRFVQPAIRLWCLLIVTTLPTFSMYFLVAVQGISFLAQHVLSSFQ